MAGLIQLLKVFVMATMSVACLKAVQKIFVLSKSGRFFLMRILMTLITCRPRYLLWVCVVSCPTGDKAALSDGRTDKSGETVNVLKLKYPSLIWSQIHSQKLRQLLALLGHYQRPAWLSRRKLLYYILIHTSCAGKVRRRCFILMSLAVFYMFFCQSNTSDIKHTFFCDVRRLQNMRQGNMGRLRLTYRQRSTRDFGRSSLSRMENWTLHFVGWTGTVSTYLSRLWHECAGKYWWFSEWGDPGS